MIDRYDYIYPGHPLTIASFVVEKYSSLEDARRRGGSFPVVLEDNDIPGAGSCVYNALNFLEIASKEGFDQAVEYAKKAWEGECSAGYKDRLVSGQEQADAIQDVLRDKLSHWGQAAASVK